MEALRLLASSFGVAHDAAAGGSCFASIAESLDRRFAFHQEVRREPLPVTPLVALPGCRLERLGRPGLRSLLGTVERERGARRRGPLGLGSHLPGLDWRLVALRTTGIPH